MSSISSFDGSEKDSLFQKSLIDGRHSYLRKTDLLDTFDSTRSRDTDTWSVAATVDDQESVISTHGGPPSVISGSRLALDRETDDDRSTLDGESSIRERLHDMHLSVTDDNETSIHQDNNHIESLRDLVNNHTQRLLGGTESVDDDEDKRSRSIAAEFGDEGARSATADFDHSVVSDDEDRNNVVDDQIMAPPQPQPSFASVTKSYAELMEENEILQSQLREAQLAQKHQDELINNLRHLTHCDDEIFDKALNLSQRTIHETHEDSLSDDDSLKHNVNTNTQDSIKSNDHHHIHGHLDKSKNLYFDSPHLQQSAMPIVNSFTLTQKLAQLAENLTRFVNAAVDQKWRLRLEQALFLQITESYLNSLPFGTENQHLLNTAYADQISRFHNTLGANFAKWYRRQTVQSLSLNPATKEYLQDMRNQLTEEMLRLLSSYSSDADRHLNNMHLWEDILELCAALSLEIHSGDADVSVQSIAVGCKFNQEVMAVIGDVSGTQDKAVNMVISPLFIDEEGTVLLPARVVLE